MSVGGFGLNGIVTNGLVLNLDAANRRSFVSGSTSWYDLSGRNNTGTLINNGSGLSFNSANGGSIQFDGTNDCVSINTDSLINNLTGDFSVSVWIYMDSLMSTKYNVIALKRFNSDYTTPFNIGYEDRLGQRSIIFSIGGGNPYFNNVGSDNNFNGVYNRWINLTTTISGTSMKLYMDSINTNSGTFLGVRTTNSNPIRLGSDYNIGTYNYPANCKISSFQIYNRALTATEILQNYNTLKNRYQ